MLNGQPCNVSGGEIYIDSTLIGNQYRTRWTCSPNAPGQNGIIIAGIGSITGLLHVSHYFLGSYEVDGDLSCFSVCGEILYPNDSLANCAILSSINDLTAKQIAISIFPIVSDGRLILQTWNEGQLQIQICDMDGRKMITGTTQGGTTQLDLTNFPNGMYLLQVINSYHQSATKKFIVQH